MDRYRKIDMHTHNSVVGDFECIGVDKKLWINWEE